MSLHLVFVLLVVLGFVFHLAATTPNRLPCKAVAWGCWLVASLIWALSGAGR